MLGWFGLDNAPDGAADRLMAALVRDLSDKGLRVAGAVQINTDIGAECACDMDILVIGEEDRPIRISQSLGLGSTGCRLDPGALEMAALRVGNRLEGAELLVIPKFGRQEAIGRGFRTLIAEAVAGGMPVILHVPPEQRDAFAEFAGDIALRIPSEDLTEWCLGAARP